GSDVSDGPVQTDPGCEALMSKSIYFRQCRMEKNLPTGTKHMTSWIPEAFAVVGKVLKLRDDGVWEDGWRVTTAGARLADDDLPDPHDDVKHHRRATGDSLPK